MADHAICFNCIKDEHLRATVESDGEPLPCELCGEDTNNAFTYEQLAKELEPVIREHFCLGPEVKKFYDNDTEGWEPEGDDLAYIVSMVMGQDVEDADALVSAIIDAEDYDPRDGDGPFFCDTSLYVRQKATPHAWVAEWQYLRDELAHRRRFFSDSARSLFDRLFEGVADLKVYDKAEGQWNPVLSELPAGTAVLRARVVRSDGELRKFLNAPADELGAPPVEIAPAGRMNAAGIAVFYGAMDAETCIAEMRPALGGRVLVGGFRTTQPIRVLDFRRLEAARLAEVSYFDASFVDQRERAVFLRHLHGLISRPVVPGHEDEYFITQTMAEFLAHVHRPALDGVIFESVQRAGGANIVLFGRDGFRPIERLDDDPLLLPSFMPPIPGEEAKHELQFPVDYVAQSAKLYVTRSITYAHEELHFAVEDKRVFVHDYDGTEDFEEGDWD